MEAYYTVYSVSEATNRIKQLLDETPELQNICIKGEISNLTKSKAGHVYFTIKDEESQVSCVRFRKFHGPDSGFPFERGDQIIARGSFSVYLPYGRYQFYVTEVQAAGTGLLHQKFTQLKEKLKGEGLFDKEHKKILPSFPSKIGIVTSPTGAVVHDIIRTLRKKYPAIDVLIAPAQVQGELAAAQMAEKLILLDRMKDIDVILLARGGGSIEDLWPFNDETLARTIFQLKTPVVSAVGHETDFSITDFVADMRAPTPTAAAELIVPDIRELLDRLENARLQFSSQQRRLIDHFKMQLDDLAQRIRFDAGNVINRKKHEINYLHSLLSRHKVSEKLNRIRYEAGNNLLVQIYNKRHRLFSSKLNLVENLKKRLSNLKVHLSGKITSQIYQYRKTLEVEREKINNMETGNILQKGYSLTYHNGKVIRSVNQVEKGTSVTTRLADGSLESEITRKNKN